MNDKDIQSRVMEELDYEPSIESTNIGVAVHAGVVTLSGHVPTYWQRVTAERAALRVKGVKAIAQELEVRLTGDKKINDDEIAERAVKLLAWNSSLPKDALMVKVSRGWVTLSGEVDWNFQRAIAESEVRKLSGVVGVTNGITLKQAVQPADVKQRIIAALKRQAEQQADRIHIDVKDGRVSIQGDVDDWAERQAIERAVWSAPGVHSVDDRVRIV
jgi:osmotically-inducible protein OsmY